MCKRLWCGLLCLLLAGCAGQASAAEPQPKPDLNAIKAAEDAAMKVYMTCVDRAAKRLDDHRSDPATIAQGVLSACGKEFDTTVETFSRYYDNYLAVRENITTQLRQTSVDFAIKQVLIYRKGARNGAALSEAQQADLQRRLKITEPSLEKYIECNVTAARGIALQPGDPMSLALAARGLCGQVEGPLRKALIDAFADIPGASSHEIEGIRQKILERSAAEIVAVRAANGNEPPPPKQPQARDY
jgi:hypothetical protein